MTEPDPNGCQLDHGDEVLSVLFVACGDLSVVFDLVEEPLDVVAFAVEDKAAGLLAPRDLGGYVRRRTIRFDAPAQPPAAKHLSWLSSERLTLAERVPESLVKSRGRQ